QSYEAVVNATERDHFLSADAARHLGIIDHVLTSRREMQHMQQACG
ncbi:MAG: ATP-dependent Clp protease proteolytic subunit, partial [Desulfovibrio sp.]|nr:ATP-dependent Clp protease proteolytic subunit [Desulfovibrio sp.]